MAVPPGRVEIGDAVRRFVRDADPLQIELHHQPSFLPVQPGEERLIGVHACNPIRHHRHQFRVHRQRVFPAVLGAGGPHLQDRLGGMELEAARRQAGQLRAPEPGQKGHEIHPRPPFAAVALDLAAAFPRGRHQPGKLLRRQRPALVAHVGFGVQPVDAGHRIGGQAPARRQPLAEFIHRLEVVVVGARPQILFPADGFERVFHRFRFKLPQRGEAAGVHQPPHARHGELPVLGRRVFQRPLKRGQVLLDRRLPDGKQTLLRRIDHAAPPQEHFVFELRRELFGQPLVGETLGVSAFAVGVHILDPPGFVFLALVAALLEDRRHDDGSAGGKVPDPR
ncbi:hypothetical protein [Paludisphaera sp.]|uniref:hypothetical protein n=1 Tax=Paludisphaera sp. TaxID=2017432 RepID=UPI00301DAEDF